MQIAVNGELREIPEGTTIVGLLQLLSLPPARLAVELDREIVKQADWAARVLQPGARVEIVHFVGGG